MLIDIDVPKLYISMSKIFDRITTPWEMDNQMMLYICAANTEMLDIKACHDSNTMPHAM